MEKKGFANVGAGGSLTLQFPQKFTAVYKSLTYLRKKYFASLHSGLI